jgi:acyl-CoA thioester hydrolase
MNEVSEGHAHRSSRVHVWVPFYDADPMGVVHHANYLRYFENARIEWFRRRGITQATMNGPDLQLAVVESQVWYRSAARFDDNLMIEVRLHEMKHISMEFAYRAVVKDDASTNGAEPRLVAEGRTVHACVGKSLRLKKIPPEMREKLMSCGEVNEASGTKAVEAP